MMLFFGISYCNQVQVIRKVTRDFAQQAKNRENFISRMSHEFRNPLFGISASLDLLRFSSNLNQSDKKLIQNIETASGVLLSFVNDFLTLMKTVSRLSFSLRCQSAILFLVVVSLRDHVRFALLPFIFQ